MNTLKNTTRTIINSFLPVIPLTSALKHSSLYYSIPFIMSERSETFKKHERLCSKKAIEALFEKGISISCYPFYVLWSYSDQDSIKPAKVAISVSKKLIKSAVQRNAVKRKIREAYRKKKYILYDFLTSAGKKINFILIYRENKVPDYFEIERHIDDTIQKLISSIITH